MFLFRVFYYLYECRYGFLRVDDENIIYWNLFRIIKIPLQDVFGAGPEKRKAREYLRLCFLAENARGFSNRLKNFKYYDAVSGPVTKLNTSAWTEFNSHGLRSLNTSGTGCRRSKKLQRCRNTGLKTKLEKICISYQRYQCLKQIYCDGKVLRYNRESENVNVTRDPQESGGEIPDELLQNHDYIIPVRDIKDVDFLKSTAAGIGTATFVWLILHNPLGTDNRIRIDVGSFITPNGNLALLPVPANPVSRL